MDAAKELQALYDREINFCVETFWDGGFTAKLGDGMNGYVVGKTFATFDEAAAWLVEQAKIRFPIEPKAMPDERRILLENVIAERAAHPFTVSVETEKWAEEFAKEALDDEDFRREFKETVRKVANDMKERPSRVEAGGLE